MRLEKEGVLLVVLSLFIGSAHGFSTSFFSTRLVQQRGCGTASDPPRKLVVGMALRQDEHQQKQESARRQLLRAGIAAFMVSPSLVFGEKIEKVKASSPGVALDMILTMKVARNLRLLDEKIQKGDFKAVDGFITNSWNSGSAAFLRKTKVLESLSVGTRGTSGSADIDADPAFANEKSPESIKVEGMVVTFYASLDQLLAASKAKSSGDMATAYATTVSQLDAYLAAVGLPSVSDADPARIITP